MSLVEISMPVYTDYLYAVMLLAICRKYMYFISSVFTLSSLYYPSLHQKTLQHECPDDKS